MKWAVHMSCRRLQWSKQGLGLAQRMAMNLPLLHLYVLIHLNCRIISNAGTNEEFPDLSNFSGQKWCASVR